MFVERHFPPNGLAVQGNKKELLLVLSYLIFNAIDAMDGLAMKVLKVSASVNTATNTILITLRTNDRPSAPWALTKDPRCVPSRRNGYCQWLEITENILARHNGTITVQSRSGNGLNAVIELPLVAGADIDRPPACQPDAAPP